mmetsp:Transcript_4252/g.13726  ORF Transcript_4252/g.13726 Transcript_4252/m.13726 type:complete len:494 (-) Transcript_4252:167-1648(-)
MHRGRQGRRRTVSRAERGCHVPAVITITIVVVVVVVIVPEQAAEQVVQRVVRVAHARLRQQPPARPPAAAGHARHAARPGRDRGRRATRRGCCCSPRGRQQARRAREPEAGQAAHAHEGDVAEDALDVITNAGRQPVLLVRLLLAGLGRDHHGHEGGVHAVRAAVGGAHLEPRQRLLGTQRHRVAVRPEVGLRLAVADHQVRARHGQLACGHLQTRKRAQAALLAQEEGEPLQHRLALAAATAATAAATAAAAACLAVVHRGHGYVDQEATLIQAPVAQDERQRARLGLRALLWGQADVRIVAVHRLALQRHRQRGRVCGRSFVEEVARWAVRGQRHEEVRLHLLGRHEGIHKVASVVERHAARVDHWAATGICDHEALQRTLGARLAPRKGHHQPIHFECGHDRGHPRALAVVLHAQRAMRAVRLVFFLHHFGFRLARPVHSQRAHAHRCPLPIHSKCECLVRGLHASSVSPRPRRLSREIAYREPVAHNRL